MRSAITIVRRHGSTQWELLAGPETHISEHRALFKGLCRSKHNEEIAEVQVWAPDVGLDRRRSFDAGPKPAPAPMVPESTEQIPQDGEAAPAGSKQKRRKYQ
ncbi:MAG: hypothetical protein E6Q97_16610 [Desulfurellales bacterium]|nr:MAG: hypothetical protein E6Q97_16610 [Desulfurellales bacterium]